MDWTWYLFRFDGRINRAKLWLAGPLMLGVMMIVAFTVIAIQSLLGAPKGFHFGAEDIFNLLDPDAYRSLTWADLPRLAIKLFGTTLLVWIYLATCIKRLHDRDKSGWWMVPFFAVPGLYDHFAALVPGYWFAVIMGAGMLVLMIWGFVELCFLKGTKWTNRFGPNPLGKEQMRARSAEDRRRATTAGGQDSEIEMVPHTASPPPAWRVKSGT